MLRTIGPMVLACGIASALAQGSQDPLETCYQISDGSARLACFDKEMQRRHAAAAASHTQAMQAKSTPGVAAAAAPAAPAVRVAADDTVGLQGADLHRKLKEQGVQPEAVKPIVAKILRLLPRSNSEFAFELDNGQTWEQAEVMPNLIVRPNDTVTIKPGLLGSFFLNTARSQRVRVHRIS